MKQLLSFCLAAVMFLAVACQTTSLEQTAYRTLGTTEATVNSAMMAWGDWVRAGYATDQDQARVRQALDVYMQVMARLQKVIGQYYEGKATKDEVSTALIEFQVKAADVTANIQTAKAAK